MNFKQYNVKVINDQETGCKMLLWCTHDGQDFIIGNSCEAHCGKCRDVNKCQIALRYILNYQAELNENYPGLYLLPQTEQFITMFQEFAEIHKNQNATWTKSLDDIKWWFDNFKEFRR